MHNQGPRLEQIYEMIEDNKMPYCLGCGRNLNGFDHHIDCMSRSPMVNHRSVREQKHADLLKLLHEAQA